MTIDEVRSANQAFYEAFESADLDAVAAIWEQSERAVCTHPGWATLHGWRAIEASFAAILQHPPPQFILTNERIEVLGDSAWVTVDENLLQAGGSGTIATVNWFVRGERGWLMVGHHGGSVVANTGDAFRN